MRLTVDPNGECASVLVFCDEDCVSLYEDSREYFDIPEIHKTAASALESSACIHCAACGSTVWQPGSSCVLHGRMCPQKSMFSAIPVLAGLLSFGLDPDFHSGWFAAKRAFDRGVDSLYVLFEIACDGDSSDSTDPD